MGGLTEVQKEVVLAFFALDESEGFVLAGGGALLAHGLVARATADLDFFSAPRDGVIGSAASALERSCAVRGWTTRRVREVDTFCRVLVDTTDGRMEVDLAIDSPLTCQPIMTPAGPTPDIIELGAMKLLALFGRAEPRDFCDVADLLDHMSREELVAMAQRLDPGCTNEALAEMMQTISRLADDELELGARSAHEIRELFEGWVDQLRSTPHVSRGPDNVLDA